MPVPVVLLRCDATVRGGIGHFVRCLALSEALRSAGADSVHLTGRIDAPLAISMLATASVTLHGAVEDASALLTLALHVGASVIHVDDYGDFGPLADMCRARGIVLSTATDAQFGRREADVIVDGAPRALRQHDALYTTADTCLGPEYLPLRAHLRAARRPARIRADGLDMLVLMGGTDAVGIAQSLAGALRVLPGVRRVGVVGGAEREGVVAVQPRPDLTEVTAPWDVVVTAAGTTVWELAALGVPMAVLGVVENQRDNYDTLQLGDLATVIGFVPDWGEGGGAQFEMDDLRASLADHTLLKRRCREAALMVDGDGAARIVSAWQAAVERGRCPGMCARPANFTDIGRLFAWRNDDLTRQSSRSTDVVGWSDHVSWVRRSIDGADRQLFVVDYNGCPQGTVRFDHRESDMWEISITVAPDVRGEGRGAEIARVATQEFRARMSGRVSEPLHLVAVLRAGNVRSRALFERLGYEALSQDDEWESWSLSPTMD